MTDEMFDDNDDFRQGTSQCMDDLCELLPGLRLRYDTEVIIGAMAEHVGAAIWAMRKKNLCDTRQANLAIRHLELRAFPEDGEPPPAPVPRS